MYIGSRIIVTVLCRRGGDLTKYKYTEIGKTDPFQTVQRQSANLPSCLRYTKRLASNLCKIFKIIFLHVFFSGHAERSPVPGLEFLFPVSTLPSQVANL